MERLTHKARYQAGYKENKDVHVWECIDKLGQLEDLEEQGKLLKLPFKIGDVAYLIRYGMAPGEYKIAEGKVYEIDIYDYGVFFKCENCKGFGMEDVGRIAFATRGEAEKRIEELN